MKTKSNEPERKQELFLPIHGHVELYREELAIIDHPAFQRLRRVKQLGLAHMVFPGVTHTRFEHSIGAVHTAQLIVEHVNENYNIPESDHQQWEKTNINDAAARFIRLAALLHDVGHLPLGHTLEDELNHLRSHDGFERLGRVAEIPYPSHEVDKVVIAPSKRPPSGWTMKDLVNCLYAEHVKALGLGDDQAFHVLSHIVSKPPKQDGAAKESWQAEAKRLGEHIPLGVCRDIVGNTICADFLDYIYRDWYHLGKPLYFDKRLYQYMEVRRPALGNGSERQPRFVINAGASEKIRHDALTDILELLNARYKLAETVLFHRSKLALTGLLDRCLLEISDLYKRSGLGAERFTEQAEALLLDASDDAIPQILKKLTAGGSKEGKQTIDAVIRQEATAIQDATGPAQRALIEGTVRSELSIQRDLVLRLIDKLRDRDVYTLACKLRMADFVGPHNPENVRVRNLLEIYKRPENRLDYLRKTEALCGLAPGTLIMNCPPDAAMNAKVAKVNLYIENEVCPFDEYEKRGQPNLTRGALLAQIDRFYELWAASVYVARRTWEDLSEGERKNFKSVLREFLFQEPGRDPNIVRAQMQPSLDAIRKKVARAASADPSEQQYQGSSFPSGLPFDRPTEK